MEKEIRRSSALACRVLVGLLFGVIWLLPSCSSDVEWTEVQSFSIDSKTISAGQQFRMEPIQEGEGLVKNNGIFYEVTFSCTRLEGEAEVFYKTTSHYDSRSSREGGFVHTQALTSEDVKQWPAGVRVQEVKIRLPFFPWEITSDREGDVYFFMIDTKDATVVSNIILVPVEIEAGAD